MDDGVIEAEIIAQLSRDVGGNRRKVALVIISVADAAGIADLFEARGPPTFIRSDNGPKFVANALRDRFARLGVKTLLITPVSPLESDYCESFNGKLRDELLNGELTHSLREAPIVIENWRREHNAIRPYSSFAYRLPAQETIMLADPACAAGWPRPYRPNLGGLEMEA